MDPFADHKAFAHRRPEAGHGLDQLLGLRREIQVEPVVLVGQKDGLFDPVLRARRRRIVDDGGNASDFVVFGRTSGSQAEGANIDVRRGERLPPVGNPLDRGRAENKMPYGGIILEQDDVWENGPNPAALCA